MVRVDLRSWHLSKGLREMKEPAIWVSWRKTVLEKVSIKALRQEHALCIGERAKRSVRLGGHQLDDVRKKRWENLYISCLSRPCPFPSFLKKHALPPPSYLHTRPRVSLLIFHKCQLGFYDFLNMETYTWLICVDDGCQGPEAKKSNYIMR